MDHDPEQKESPAQTHPQFRLVYLAKQVLRGLLEILLDSKNSDFDDMDDLHRWIGCELEQKKSLKYYLGGVYPQPYPFALYENWHQEQVVLLPEIEEKREPKKEQKRKGETLLTFGLNYIKSTYF